MHKEGAMTKIAEEVEKVVKDREVHNLEKLKSQQEYYKRLSDKGIVKKQSYDLKPISALLRQ